MAGWGLRVVGRGSFLSEISTPEVNFFFFGTGSFFPAPDWGLKSGLRVRRSGEKSAGRRRGKSTAEAGAPRRLEDKGGAAVALAERADLAAPRRALGARPSLREPVGERAGPILCDPMEPARLLCPWDFAGKNTEMGCHLFLQGTFPTQGSNPCLRHYRQILYC